MKKSILYVLFISLLCLSVMFVSCDGDSSTDGNGNGNSHPSSLVGVWAVIEAIVTETITTNSNQTAVDLISEGTGALNVTGSENATLTYVAAIDSGGVVQGMASNVPLFEILDLNDLKIREKIRNPNLAISELKTASTYPLYILYFSSEEGSYFSAMQDETTGSAYFGTIDGLSFDMTTYTLTATNYTLYGYGYDQIVIINGQLQGAFLNIPANTPTALINEDMTEYFEGDSLAVNADGTYTGDLGDEPSAGTWNVTGTNTLVITDTTENDTTIYATYALSDGDLILTMDSDPCEEEYENQTDCFNYYENMFGLDEGSITALTAQMTITLTKTGAAKP